MVADNKNVEIIFHCKDLVAYELQILSLKMICKPGQFEKAIEYIETSVWSISHMIEYISMTGEVPDKKMADHPGYTISATSLFLRWK